ncbi:hypothetical protein AMTR_s05086p00000650 [Amborella trichopoda]|uniref:Uncharacterized protein n=1 Tax=Amborella trichopoda TaxID=13333 RepID=U5CZZ3_AMBTC|nr:hypothetical protein AMTR_s05086p00000650 [Amborella trichopoda]
MEKVVSLGLGFSVVEDEEVVEVFLERIRDDGAEELQSLEAVLRSKRARPAIDEPVKAREIQKCRALWALKERERCPF